MLELKVLIGKLGAINRFSSSSVVVGKVTSLAHEILKREQIVGVRPTMTASRQNLDMSKT